jgi:hypothetical protein
MLVIWSCLAMFIDSVHVSLHDIQQDEQLSIGIPPIHAVLTFVTLQIEPVSNQRGL